MSVAESLHSKDIPYIPFPKNPETINVGGFDVFNYIRPPEMSSIIKNLSDRVNLHKYEHVIVNLKGGNFLFEALAKIQNYKRDSIPVEIHRPKDGFGAIVTNDVPKEFWGTHSLAIDDIYDSGGTLLHIMSKLSPDSGAAALITKVGIKNQIPIHDLEIGAKIDIVWVGGCGMDLGKDGEANIFRSYPGIVVNPPPLKL